MTEEKIREARLIAHKLAREYGTGPPGSPWSLLCNAKRAFGGALLDQYGIEGFDRSEDECDPAWTP